MLIFRGVAFLVGPPSDQPSTGSPPFHLPHLQPRRDAIRSSHVDTTHKWHGTNHRNFIENYHTCSIFVEHGFLTW